MQVFDVMSEKPSGDRLRSAASLRILVVDDEALIRWSLLETLTSGGHAVVEAGDAASAVQAVTAAAVPFDVVLLDFRLPDSNDLALLSCLRRLAPATRIIVMTAYGTPEILQKAMDLGAYRVITKPFEMNDVAPLVTQAHASRS
jgi:DNA-binding NtrC family response regulator